MENKMIFKFSKHKFFLIVTLLLIEIQFLQSQNFEWVRTFNSNGQAWNSLNCIDSASNIYSFGFFRDTLHIEGSNQILPSEGHSDLFLNKKDEYGNNVWDIHIGGFWYDNAGAIKYDPNGYIYILGTISDSAYFRKNGVVQNFRFHLANSLIYEMFLLKLDLDGNIVWSQFMHGINRTRMYGACIDIDQNSNVYIAGQLEDTLIFNQSPLLNLSSLYYFDGFIAKYSSSGQLLQTASLPGTFYSSIRKLEINGNRLAVLGAFTDTVDLDPSQNIAQLRTRHDDQIFLAEYDLNLNFQWGRKIESNVRSFAFDMIEKDSSYYICGIFLQSATFDSSRQIILRAAGQSFDSFFAKYSNTGNLTWVKQITGNHYNSIDAIEFDNNNKLYLAGRFSGPTNFSPGSNSNVFNSVNGTFDTFYLSADTNGSINWVQTFGGSGHDLALNFMHDKDDLYISGHFENTVDFNVSSRVENRISFGGTDSYLLKLSYGISTHMFESDLKSSIELFPNPVREYIQIQSQVTSIDSYSIYDLNGKLIQIGKYREERIEVSELENGIYFLRLIGKYGVVTQKKFIKID